MVSIKSIECFNVLVAYKEKVEIAESPKILPVM